MSAPFRVILWERWPLEEVLEMGWTPLPFSPWTLPSPLIHLGLELLCLERAGLPEVAARTPLRRRPLIPGTTMMIMAMAVAAHLQGMEEGLQTPLHLHPRTLLTTEMVQTPLRRRLRIPGRRPMKTAPPC